MSCCKSSINMKMVLFILHGLRLGEGEGSRRRLELSDLSEVAECPLKLFDISEVAWCSLKLISLKL